MALINFSLPNPPQKATLSIKKCYIALLLLQHRSRKSCEDHLAMHKVPRSQISVVYTGLHDSNLKELTGVIPKILPDADIPNPPCQSNGAPCVTICPLDGFSAFIAPSDCCLIGGNRTNAFCI
jgi:hypothetical protein